MRPEMFVRVGYPTVWDDLIGELEPNQKVREFAESFGVRHGGKAYREFLVGLCKAVNRSRGFGGRDRSIWVECRPDLLDQEFEILGKRVVRTGRYYPPSFSRGGYEWESEYEDGGLDNARTHVILDLGFIGQIEERNVALAGRS